MSLEAARAFLEKLHTDATLQAQLEKLASNEERQRLITEAGFACTVDEVRQAGQEVSDDQLGNVSGGKWIRL